MTQRQPTLSHACQKLDTLKKREKELKTKYESAKQEREIYELELIQRMEGEEAESHRTKGVLYSVAKTTYGSIQDRSEFVKWAEVHAPELLESKERKGLVHEIVRQRQDDGEDLPPGVGFYVKEYISRTAS